MSDFEVDKPFWCIFDSDMDMVEFYQEGFNDDLDEDQQDLRVQLTGRQSDCNYFYEKEEDAELVAAAMAAMRGGTYTIAR